ncbi:hypothetical protein, partial [Methylorubrum aminovorans]|uniref:hypothetical protein n=1 Tax=Methylorubrum aminovorans TaxID=269069 RepID=UPI0031D92F7B
FAVENGDAPGFGVDLFSIRSSMTPAIPAAREPRASRVLQGIVPKGGPRLSTMPQAYGVRVAAGSNQVG